MRVKWVTANRRHHTPPFPVLNPRRCNDAERCLSAAALNIWTKSHKPQFHSIV